MSELTIIVDRHPQNLQGHKILVTLGTYRITNPPNPIERGTFEVWANLDTGMFECPETLQSQPDYDNLVLSIKEFIELHVGDEDTVVDFREAFVHTQFGGHHA